MATNLLTGAQLGYNRRDYCGRGLQCSQGRFEYVEWWDYATVLIDASEKEADFVQ